MTHAVPKDLLTGDIVECWTLVPARSPRRDKCIYLTIVSVTPTSSAILDGIYCEVLTVERGKLYLVCDRMYDVISR